MLGFDFDFVRYVQRRKGQVEQRARDGAAYAFSAERKLRRTLAMAKPVALAIEGTSRLWKGSARRELLERARPASDQHHPRLHLAAREAARRLGVEPATVYVVEDFPVVSATLGTDDDAVIVVRDHALRGLGDGELLALCGHELGHVQNNQVLLATALFYLRHRAIFFVRWTVQPAILALAAWSRRAEISCDRAALIASRDLDATMSYVVRSGLGPDATDADVVAGLAAGAPRGIGRFAEVLRSHPVVDKRLAALRLFADSALYRKLTGRDPGTGITTEELDLKVGDIVSVLQ
jgi:Zn-dependent protease with chaperone function